MPIPCFLVISRDDSGQHPRISRARVDSVLQLSITVLSMQTEDEPAKNSIESLVQSLNGQRWITTFLSPSLRELRRSSALKAA